MVDKKGVKEEERPWGQFKEFCKNEKCTVKILEVNSGEELSLQKHKNRREMWYFLTEGKVQIDDNKFKVEEGEKVEIPKGVAHRIIGQKNKTKVLEVSFGNFDENDEIRLEDKYGRE